jgi:deoxyribodipyrimidine photolyase-related protein
VKLALILGDQMDRESSLFEQLDHGEDVILMAEVAGETEQVWNHKCRIALFLAAMRHFRDELRKKGYQVRYWGLEEKGNPGSLGEALALAVREYRPERVLVVEPGEYRVREELQKVADREGVELEICEDRHFFTTPKDFAAHAAGRKQLRLEYFYRELRKRFGVLMEGGKPCGGEWNYDAENRESLPKTGPGRIPEPVRFLPDGREKVCGASGDAREF